MKEMKQGTQGIVEGFEGKFVIIEIEGASKDVPKELLQPGSRAGDVVIWNGQQWEKDNKATQERSREIQKLMEDVWID